MAKDCSPEEIALKSFFIGPQAENAPWVLEILEETIKQWVAWRKSLYPEDGEAISIDNQQHPDFIKNQEKISGAVKELMERLEKEVPTFPPRYIGHMVSEISVPALLGHMLTLLHNPNNIVTDVSLVGTEIELEAVSELAKMIGYSTETTRGHFTSGGTIANIEAMIRARARMARFLAAATWEKVNKQNNQTLFEAAHIGWEAYDKITSETTEEELQFFHLLFSNPLDLAKSFEKAFETEYRGPVVLVSGSKHYSWPKGVMLLGLGNESLWQLELDNKAKVCLTDLKNKISKAKNENRPIMMVASIAGTTELGDFDRIHEVADYLDELKEKEGIDIYHHVDAAYGGYFCSLPPRDDTLASLEFYQALNAIKRANSVTVDPHKLGYVPYSSGTFLAKHSREYYVTPFEAPYLRFEQSQHLGKQTLEGSRSAAGPVATWLTAKSIGLNDKGYGLILERTIRQRQKLGFALAKASPDIRVAPYSETNILCFCLASAGESITSSNSRTIEVYNRLSHEGEGVFYVSRTDLQWKSYKAYLDEFTSSWKAVVDDDNLTLLRLTMMNPFFDSKETETNFTKAFIAEILK